MRSLYAVFTGRIEGSFKALKTELTQLFPKQSKPKSMVILLPQTPIAWIYQPSLHLQVFSMPTNETVIQNKYCTRTLSKILAEVADFAHFFY